MALPGNELMTLTYPGGTARAPRGFIEYLFAPQQRVWRRRGSGSRPYKTRQKSNAAAGEAMKVVIEGGDAYTFRVTGTHASFVDQVVSKAIVPILNIYSERGTEYGPELDNLAAPVGP